jgi:hypothetical protein
VFVSGLCLDDTCCTLGAEMAVAPESSALFSLSEQQNVKIKCVYNNHCSGRLGINIIVYLIIRAGVAQPV